MSQTIAQLQTQIREVKEGREKALRLRQDFFILTENEQKEIINQIGQMEQLKLDLSSNNLTELPDWLARLTHLV